MEQVEAEMRSYKLLKRKNADGSQRSGSKPKPSVDYEIYIPPNAEDIKTKGIIKTGTSPFYIRMVTYGCQYSATTSR